MIIELSGGIGNQLFQYSFGRYVSDKTNAEVSYIYAPKGMTETVHRSKLVDFQFLDKQRIQERNLISSNLARAGRYAIIRSEKLRRILKSYFGYYAQEGSGYDAEFFNHSNPSFVRGYFQSYLYSSEIKENLILDFNLTSPTTNFKNYASDAKRIKPIMVHVRQGDYVGLMNSVGMLSEDYYLNGICQLLEKLPNSEVWMFSDNPKGLGRLIELIRLQNTAGVRVISELSDSESLKLMSMGAGIVIANSTFSWWAAFLGNYEELVVSPVPWFKSLREPQDLLPPSWTRLPSSWY